MFRGNDETFEIRRTDSYNPSRLQNSPCLFQGLNWSLTDVANKLEASRLLTYRAAQVIDEDGDAMLPAAHAKKFAGDYGVPAIAACIQAMGAAGMRSGVPLSRHLACAKLACYTDGSTEMMNERIGKGLVASHGG